MARRGSSRTVFERPSSALSAKFTHGAVSGRAESREPVLLVPCYNGATLLQTSKSRLFTLAADDDIASAVALAPGCKTVFIAGRSGFAVLNWITENSKKPRTWRPLENSVVVHATFDSSGALLAVGPSAGSIRLYDIDAFHVTHELPIRNDSLITTMSFHPSPDEMLFFVGMENGSIICFDLAVRSRKPRYVVQPHVSLVSSLSFVDSGRCVVAASKDCTLSVSKTRNGDLIRLISTDEEVAGVVGTTLDSHVVITGGSEGVLKSWNVYDGKEISSRRFYVPLVTKVQTRSVNDQDGSSKSDTDLDVGEVQNAITSVVPCGSCTFAVTLTDHSVVILSHGGPGTIQKKHVTFGNLEQINDMCAVPAVHPRLSSNGSFQDKVPSPAHEIVIASNSNALWVVRLPRGIQRTEVSSPCATTSTKDSEVTDDCHSKDGFKSNLSEDPEKVGDWTCVDVLAAHRGIVLAIDSSHGSSTKKVSSKENISFLASGSRDKTARLWHRDTAGRWRCLAVADGHTDAVTAVALSPQFHDGSAFLVTAANDRTVKRWNVDYLPAGGTKGCSGANSILENSKSISVQPQEQKLMAKWTILAHEKDINSAAISPDGQIICSGSQDRTVKLWSASDGELRAICRGHRRGIFDVCFSPVDRVVASSSGDFTIRIWNVHTGSCLRTLQGHSAGVLKSIFMTRGTQLVSSSMDGLMKVWSVRSGECESTLDGHSDSVWALTAIDDGDCLLSGGMDGMIQIWSDETKLKAQETAVRKEHEIVLAQRVNDASRSRKWAEAAVIALEASMPRKLKETLSQVVISCENSEKELVRIVKEVHLAANSDEKMSRLLKYCRDWNSTGGTWSASLAVRVLQAVFTVLVPSELCSLVSGDKRNLVEALAAHTSRHHARVVDLDSRAYFLDYTLEAMRALPESTSCNAPAKSGQSFAAQSESLTNDTHPMTKRRKIGYEGHVSEY